MGKKLLKYSEWQGGSGRWYCDDIDVLSKERNPWFLPARLLGLTPAQYLQWVIDNYSPDHFMHNADYSFVGWSWDHKNQGKMRKFKNKINSLAKEHNCFI